MSELPIRQDLTGLSPYGAPQLAVPVRLNVNENPFAPSEALAEAMAQAVRDVASGLNRYPDRDAIELREALARFISAESSVDVTSSNVWPANGSNEVMLQLLQLFGGPGRKLVTFSPTYSMYVDYCRDTFTEFITVARNEDFSVDRELIDVALRQNPDIIVLASPNNPSGTFLPADIIEYVCEKFSGVVIIDEAYAEFRSAGTPSAVSRIAEHPRLVVTRTMSKAFSCAGLRLGYAVAGKDVVDAIQLVRLPYHLSAVTQAVACAAVSFSEELLGQVELIRNERESLRIWMTDHGFDVAPSEANFLMFGQFVDRDVIWAQLLERGVLIRQVGPIGWLRVSIGTPTENATFKTSLLEIVGSGINGTERK